MKKKKSYARRRRRIYRIKLFSAIGAFVLVLCLTVGLVIYRNEIFPSDTPPSIEETPKPPVEDIPDADQGEEEVDWPDYPAAEPQYEPLYGEEYSTFRLPRKTEEFAFVEKIIEIALSEPVDAEDANGVTKYGTFFGTPTYEWCTEFAVWCILQAQEEMGVEYMEVRYPYEDWSGGCVRWYKEKGLFFRRDSYVPRRGDMIFFDYDYDGSTDHTGLVTGVEYDPAEDKIYILTVEGNLPEDYPVGSIKQRRLACDWKKIYGYGTFLFVE